MIEPGKYVAQPQPAELGVSDTEKEYVAIPMKIVEGRYAGETRIYRGYFTEKTTERTMETLRYCGWKNHDLTDLDGVGNCLVEIVIEHEEYKEKLHDKISWVNKLGGPSVKTPLEGPALAAFSMRMRAAAAAVPLELANGPEYIPPDPSNGNEAAPPFGDDDIPF